MADYFSFEDVMKELEVSEDDLKRMVSEGELRAFRDENKMKFKKEDVDNLKKGRITEPTIILPSTPAGGQDETVLDLDISNETSALQADQIKSSKPQPAEETSDDLLVQPNKEEESVIGMEAEDTFIEEEGETGLTTEPLKLADEVESAETVEAESVTEEVAETPKRASGMRRRVTAQVPMATEEEIERRKPSPVWTIFLLLALICSVYSGIFLFDLLRMDTGRGDKPTGLTSGMAKWTLDQFWGDKNWTKFHEREFVSNPPFTSTTGDRGAVPHREYKGSTFLEDDIPQVKSGVQ
jgi:excisionase family DNA binding protein